MRNLIAIAVTVCLWAAVGCDSKPEVSECSNYSMSGEEGMAFGAAGCPDDKSYAVACEAGDGATTCTCSENGVAGKTFEATDGRLPQDYNDAITTVNTGCGWSIPPKG